MFGEQKLSGVIKLLIYILILFPVLIAALKTLALDAVTPAGAMLSMILAALPAIFSATVLIISYVVGQVIAKLISNLLSGLGFDTILAKLEVSKEPRLTETKHPSQFCCRRLSRTLPSHLQLF